MNVSDPDSAVEDYMSNPGGELGPWLAGGLADFLLQGAIFAMTYAYYTSITYRTDGMITRWLVTMITFLNIVKSAQTFAILWEKFAIHFGDWSAATGSSWPQFTEPLLTAIIGFFVQGYFVMRVFRLLGRNFYVLFFLVGCMFVGLGGAIGLTMLIVEYQDAVNQASFNTSVITMLGGVLACDLVITFSVIFHLLRSKSGGKTSDGLIERLIQVTMTSAAPPSFCAALNLAFYVGLSYENYVFIGFNLAMPKLYSISMIYTIMSRATLLEDLERLRHGAAQLSGSSFVQRVSHGWTPALMMNSERYRYEYEHYGQQQDQPPVPPIPSRFAGDAYVTKSVLSSKRKDPKSDSDSLQTLSVPPSVHNPLDSGKSSTESKYSLNDWLSHVRTSPLVTDLIDEQAENNGLDLDEPEPESTGSSTPAFTKY